MSGKDKDDQQQAFNVLTELENEGKISAEKAAEYKEKFRVLHEACMQNMINENKLAEKMSQLKKKVSTETLNLEKVQQDQKNHEINLKQLEEKLDTAKKETNEVDERNTLLSSEISRLESLKQEQASNFAMEEQAKRDALIPEIAQLKSWIENEKRAISHAETHYDELIKRNEELEKKLEEKNAEQENKEKQIGEMEELAVKEAQEPIRIEKQNESSQNGVQALQEDRDKLSKQKKDLEFQSGKLDASLDKLKADLEAIKKDFDSKEKELNLLGKDVNNLTATQQALEKDAQEFGMMNSQINYEIKDIQTQKRLVENHIKQRKKEFNEFDKVRKQQEELARGLQSDIQGIVTMDSGYVKMTNELRSEMSKLETQKTNLEEEQQIYVGQLVRKGLEFNATKDKLAQLDIEIRNEKQIVKDLQTKESILTV